MTLAGVNSPIRIHHPRSDFILPPRLALQLRPQSGTPNGCRSTCTIRKPQTQMEKLCENERLSVASIFPSTVSQSVSYLTPFTLSSIAQSRNSPILNHKHIAQYERPTQDHESNQGCRRRQA